ncbi:MAG TPA: glutathione S-transferase family protein [Steroidobacteraceae bacterium]|jgi:glutathione S-transferase
MLKIYATPLSANGRKVLAVSAQLGLRPEIHLVNVYGGEGRDPAYLAINPAGKIPTLVDGAFVLFESNAILIYLAEAYGANRLWSSDAKAKSKIAQWLFWEAAHWQPALIAFLSQTVGHRLFPDKVAQPKQPLDWDSSLIQPALKTLQAGLVSDPFLLGPEPTLADFSVAGMMTYFGAAEFPAQQFPVVSAWYARMQALEGWRSTESAVWSTR